MLVEEIILVYQGGITEDKTRTIEGNSPGTSQRGFHVIGARKQTMIVQLKSTALASSRNYKF